MYLCYKAHCYQCNCSIYACTVYVIVMHNAIVVSEIRDVLYTGYQYLIKEKK